MKSVRLACIAVLLFLAIPSPDRVVGAQGQQRPSLVVILVVDQMRADYLERYGARFSGGLQRLMKEGAYFDHAAYPYLNTITCAGHSTIGTGRLPYQHGMILNEWFDRTAQKSVACTADASTKTIGYDGKETTSDSAKNLLVPTLADSIRERGGHVVTLSIKARSAIGLAGHGADMAVWFNEERGTWLTSSAYASSFDPALRRYIDAHPVTADYGKTWERTYDVAAYKNTDEGEGERPSAGWTRTFPHPLTSASGNPDSAYFTLWLRSPYADDYLGRMAAAMVDEKGLGTSGRTDFLGVSFSSLDLVGHQFGPNSHEVQDMVARLDRTIGALLDHLDAKVGRGRYVLALTSDHGVAEIPEQVGSGRTTSRDVSAAVDAALQPIFGPGKYVAFSAYTDIYLSSGVLDRLKQNPAATRAALDALRALPGIAFAFRGDEVSDPSHRTDADPVKRAAALNYYQGRSGDLIIVPKEKWIFSTSATTHGTLYPYDQRVPVIFFGAGVKAGRQSTPATPADVAPTLANMTNVPLPGTDGQALRSAMAWPPATR